MAGNWKMYKTPEETTVFFENFRGLVEQSAHCEIAIFPPFTSLAAVGSRHYPLLPVRLLLRDRFPVTELIGQVRVPTVIVYGSADTIVPPEQSKAVATAAGGPVRVVPVVGADHNDAALLEGNVLIAAVLELARSLP